jgi:hypothetical protein
MSANPDDSERLHLAWEANEIEGAIRSSSYRDHFEFRQVGVTRIEDLADEMIRFQPHIFHFSGHGKHESIALVDENHQNQFISKEQLAELFLLFKGTIKCVFLNACFSLVDAEVIGKSVPFVLGFSDRVRDGHAIMFSKNFYKTIGEGRDLEFAFQLAKLTATMNGLDIDGMVRYSH